MQDGHSIACIVELLAFFSYLFFFTVECVLYRINGGTSRGESGRATYLLRSFKDFFVLRSFLGLRPAAVAAISLYSNCTPDFLTVRVLNTNVRIDLTHTAFQFLGALPTTV